MRLCAVSDAKSTLLPVPTENLHHDLAAVHAFVASDAGRSAIRNALVRRRLPGYLDVEIEEAVLGEALRYLKNGGEIDSPAGWCRTRITARSIDLARGALREKRRWGERVAFPDDLPDETLEVDDMTEESAGAPGGDVDQVRRDLLRAAESETAIAGALTFVSRIAENAELPAECPQPAAGATTEESAMWAVLWYLGRRDCFGAGNTEAKRRSRAARGVRELLRNWGNRP